MSHLAFYVLRLELELRYHFSIRGELSCDNKISMSCRPDPTNKLRLFQGQIRWGIPDNSATRDHSRCISSSTSFPPRFIVRQCYAVEGICGRPSMSFAVLVVDGAVE